MPGVRFTPFRLEKDSPMTTRFFHLAAASFALMLASTAQANLIDLTTLEDLLQGDTITNGDKFFDNFTYDRSGDMPKAKYILVQPHTDNDGNYGLIFYGNFEDKEGNGASEATIGYTVSVTDPDLQIVDAHLKGDIDVSKADYGYGSVTDTFEPDSDLQLQIFNGDGTSLTDSGDFEAGFSELQVQKQIVFDADAFLNSTTLNFFGDFFKDKVKMSYVWQTYSQGPAGGGEPIPEPATLGLIALGALAGLRRR
jgi:hypothetical protein